MTPAELDAIEARAARATEGPWEDQGDEISHSTSYPEPYVYTTVIGLEACGSGYLTYDRLVFREADRVFVAAARTDVPALVAEVRRLRAILDDLDYRPDEP